MKRSRDLLTVLLLFLAGCDPGPVGWTCMGVGGAIVIALLIFAISSAIGDARETARRDRETQRAIDARMQQFREAEEDERRQKVRHERDLEAAALHGNSGESVEEAARRLGVDLRHKTGTEWWGRKGELAYRVPLSGDVVFTAIDPDAPVDVPPEAFAREGGTWEHLETRDYVKPYHEQSYDGDDIGELTMAVDEIGREIEIREHAGWGRFVGWRR